jgi:hypothetical protein
MAPPPKPPGQRNRRNLGQSKWAQLPADGADDEREIPPFPFAKPAMAALAYWRMLWASPMATMYVEADQIPLARLCKAHATYLRTGKAKDLSAVTGLEDRYGLSPKSRRALQWEIERAAGPGAASAPQRREQRRKAAGE